MRNLVLGIIALGTSMACAAATPVKHFAPAPFPAGSPLAGMAPPFSEAVMAGDTLYVAGTTDMDPTTGKPAADPTAGAKLVLDNIKATVTKAGLTMNDLVWVQVFASDLANFKAFNTVYRTYFTGPMPARAFIGAGSLLGGAHYEVMGIAVKSK
jgi:2-iminobutanoate/2-iminopropanoate deaminase